MNKEMTRLIEMVQSKIEYAESVLPKIMEAQGQELERGDARIVTAKRASDGLPVFELRYNWGGDEPAYFVLKTPCDGELVDFSRLGENIDPVDEQLEMLSLIFDQVEEERDKFSFNWLGE